MKRITIIAAALATAALVTAALATAALATTYIQTSSTGVAPWKPVKDSVSQAHLADSCRKADSSRAAWKADSAHVAWFAHAATYADSARVSGLADSAKKSGTASNSLTLGGIAAAQYGTLAQDTLIAKNVASDTATVLRAGIASAITTSEAYATARISDSLSANTRAWTTLGAAKSSIHDSLAVERTFDTLVARNVARDTATSLRAYVGSYINQPLLTTSSPTFAYLTAGNAGLGTYYGGNGYSWFGRNSDYAAYKGFIAGDNLLINQPAWNGHIYLLAGGVDAIDVVSTGGTVATTHVAINGQLSASGAITANSGIIGQGNVGSSTQPWNAGYFSTAGIDIGGGLLTFNSPSSSTALLGVTAHPITIATATGAVTFPAGIGINGALGLSVVSVGGTTYSASAHRGRILTIAPSTTFTLPLGTSGDWFIIQSSAAQGPNQSAGVITPSGTTIYIRGTAYSGPTYVIGTLVAYCNGVYWYIG